MSRDIDDLRHPERTGDDFTRHEFCADCTHADGYCYAGTILSSWVLYVRAKYTCPCKNGGPLNDPARRPEDADLTPATDSLPAEVEEVLRALSDAYFINMVDAHGVSVNDADRKAKRYADTLRSHISSLTEEYRRLRDEPACVNCHEDIEATVVSLTEEVERLRERAVNAERILLSDDYTVEAVATIEADRDEWKARAEWLATFIAFNEDYEAGRENGEPLDLDNMPDVSAFIRSGKLAGQTAKVLTASLSAVKEDQ